MTDKQNEHDDDLGPEVDEGAEVETENFPDDEEELDKTAETVEQPSSAVDVDIDVDLDDDEHHRDAPDSI